MISRTIAARIAATARQQGYEPAVILAIAEVESGGNIYAKVGGRPEPLIRFEGHYFDRRLSGAKRGAARRAGLADPRAGRIANPRDQVSRWAMLARAKAIDRDAALESCSWGIGQVMGAHWAWLGYASVSELVAEARSGADGQIRLMLRFIRKAGLRDAIERHDWAAFARKYNGPAYARHHYDKRIASAYERFAKLELDGAPPRSDPPGGGRDSLARGARGKSVAALQRMLAAIGYPLVDDGSFGPLTAAAVARFQKDYDLDPTGIAGAATLDAIAGALPANRLIAAITGWIRRFLPW